MLPGYKRKGTIAAVALVISAITIGVIATSYRESVSLDYTSFLGSWEFHIAWLHVYELRSRKRLFGITWHRSCLSRSCRPNRVIAACR